MSISLKMENWVTKCVFLTGASGYIGRNVARALLAEGLAVSGLVRSDGAAAVVSRLSVSPIIGDLTRPESFRRAASEADIIIHAGFQYDAAGQEVASTDILATRALLKAAEKSKGVSSFVYTSSLFEYHAPGGGICDEQTAEPRSPDRWRCDLESEVLRRASDTLAAAAVRVGWVYGRDGGTLAEAVVALSRHMSPHIANHRVPLIHVDDLARLYVRIAVDRLSGAFHGCTGLSMKLAELVTFLPAGQDLITGTSSDEHLLSVVFGDDFPARSVHDPRNGLAHESQRLRASLAYDLHAS